MHYFVILLVIIATGCAPTIKRIGYNSNDYSGNLDNCNPSIVKNQNYNSAGYKKIGEIKIDDSGFSTNCEESDVLKILKDEACKCGADVINIIEEKRADLLSTCYRTTAELIKVENKDSIKVAVNNSSSNTPSAVAINCSPI